MLGEERARLLAHAAEILRAHGYVCGKYCVTVAIKGESFTFCCAAHEWPAPPGRAEAAPPAAPGPGWRMFTDLEERIVTRLKGRGWMTTADLAAAIGEEPGSDFRCVVRQLGERGVLETSTKHGVRLTDPGLQHADAG